MDALRHPLIFGQTGLPLGIITAKTRFVDAMYLITPEFRWGISGVPGWRRIWLGLLIALCSGLSLLAGPSAALLLIPQRFTDWSAGGATYRIVGSSHLVWPQTLNADFIGGKHCRLPTEGLLFREPANHSSCIWIGHQSLKQSWQRLGISQLSTREGGLSRDMSIQYYTHSAAAFSVSLATCTAGDVLSSLWWNAVLTTEQSRFYKNSRLRFRDRGATVAKVKTEMPVVRVSCTANDTGGLEMHPDDEPFYPLQFEYPADYENGTIIDGERYDIHDRPRAPYQFAIRPTINSSRIATTWIESPKNESIGTHIINGSASGHSSAYLKVQVPYPNGTGHNSALCAVDARWVKNEMYSSNVGNINGLPTYRSRLLRVRDTTVFPAKHNGDWSLVRLGLDWLTALTPPLGNASHWNTLSILLAGLNITNATSEKTEIAAVVASVVADGMSRIGYQKNGGDPSISYLGKARPGISYLEQSDDESYKRPIIQGSYELPLAPEVAASGSPLHKLRWSVYASGLGYKASSTSYFLAIAVLLIDAIIALLHIG
jgi:hypothetical protein